MASHHLDTSRLYITWTHHGVTRLGVSRNHVLHPTPYTLHPTPNTLHPTPYALHLKPLHPKPNTIHPKPCTLNLNPYTLHPTPYTLHPTPCTPEDLEPVLEVVIFEHDKEADEPVDAVDLFGVISIFDIVILIFNI